MSTSTITRTALIKGNGVTLQRVAAFLPSNYEVWGWDDTGTAVVVKGHDSAGWTMDDYVLPRLASGCLFGTEVRRCQTCQVDGHDQCPLVADCDCCSNTAAEVTS